MTPLTVEDGKLVVRNGALGTEQACCCEPPCSGPCEDDQDCAPGCECVDGECESGCLDTFIQGFTDQFAPENWTLSTNVIGTSVLFQNANTTLRLAKNANADPTGIASAEIDVDDVLNSIGAPGLNCCLIGIQYSYDWSWFTSNNTNANFEFKSLPAPGTLLNIVNGTSGNPLTGTYNSGLIPVPDSPIGFLVDALNQQVGTGTGTISNFQFTAIYEPCENPLP